VGGRSGRQIGAHRLAYELTYGRITSSALFVLHKCDNPPCCNPAHLKLGTHADNMADMARKGRTPEQRGSKGHNAKLTEADVIAIREEVASGVPQSLLVSKYGLSKGSICDIVNCKTWTHVPDVGAPIRAARKAEHQALVDKLGRATREAFANFDPAAWSHEFRRQRSAS
jgi:hypothetical protein